MVEWGGGYEENVVRWKNLETDGVFDTFFSLFSGDAAPQEAFREWAMTSDRGVFSYSSFSFPSPFLLLPYSFFLSSFFPYSSFLSLSFLLLSFVLPSSFFPYSYIHIPDKSYLPEDLAVLLSSFFKEPWGNTRTGRKALGLNSYCHDLLILCSNVPFFLSCHYRFDHHTEKRLTVICKV